VPRDGTSAILLHRFCEPGGERVQELLADGADEILICPVCIAEFARRLAVMQYGMDEGRSRSLACVSLAGATLVHRDAHFRVLPAHLLQRVDL
jgi:hypothetical protein